VADQVILKGSLVEDQKKGFNLLFNAKIFACAKVLTWLTHADFVTCVITH